MQGCFTGQPPGTDGVYTGQSPDGSRLVGTAGLVSARSWPRGGRSPSRLWWVERSSNKRAAAKEEAAAWVRRADQRDTRADAVAARRDGGVDLALAWASADKAECLVAPPTPYFGAQDHLFVQNSKTKPYGDYVVSNET